MGVIIVMRSGWVWSLSPQWVQLFVAAVVVSYSFVGGDRQHLTGQPGGVVSLLLPSVSGPLLPQDWPFLPVISQYTHTQHWGTTEEGSGDIVPVVNSLRFLLLLELRKPRILAGISLTTRLARLMCVFLAGKSSCVTCPHNSHPL